MFAILETNCLPRVQCESLLSVKNSYTCSLYSCILIDTVPSYCTFCTPGNSVFWLLAKIMLCVYVWESRSYCVCQCRSFQWIHSTLCNQLAINSHLKKKCKSDLQIIEVKFEKCWKVIKGSYWITLTKFQFILLV